MNRKDVEYVAQTTALLATRGARLELAQGSHVAARDAMELHRIATRLHRFDERNCNEDLTCPTCHGDGSYIVPDKDGPTGREATRKDCRTCAGRGHTLGRREALNEKRAREIASAYGLCVYFQGDCRGCPLYLIPEDEIPEAGRLGAYTYDSDGPTPDPTAPEMRDKLRSRWLASNYNRGAAVCHLG